MSALTLNASGRVAGAAGGLAVFSSIQYLRAIAALMVVVSHALARDGRISSLNCGVDIFFVISGFIMWSVAHGRDYTAFEFAKRRLLRIAPLYWVVTAAVAVVASVLPWIYYRQPTTDTMVLSALLIPYRTAPQEIGVFLGPGWTLTLEMLFYAVFSASLFLKARRLEFIIGALLALVALRLVFHPTSAIGATYTSPLLLEFLAGVLVGAWATSGRLPGRMWGWAMLSLGAAVLAWYLAHPETFYYVGKHNFRRAAIMLPMAALVIAGAVSIERDGGVPKWPLGLLLGDASYSIYLSHEVGLIGAHHLGKKFALTGLGAVAFSIPIAILCALALYYVVERPLLAFAHTPSRRMRSGARAASPGALPGRRRA